MSKIIVIEGADRVGKATQSRLLKEFLQNRGSKATVVEVPLKSNFLYSVIYWMLGNGLAKKFPNLFQWFQYMNRKIFQRWSLPKLEEKYDYIIFDRWSLSTVVYGTATGLAKDFVEKLYHKLRNPDHTIVLVGPSHFHVAEDVYESDSELQKKVRAIYSQWADENKDICLKVDCSLDKETISKLVVSSLMSKDIV